MQTIKIPEDVHKRLKAHAAEHRVTLGGAIDELLHLAEQEDFWAGVAAQRPDDSYRAETDNVAALTDAEARIEAFEAGAR